MATRSQEGTKVYKGRLHSLGGFVEQPNTASRGIEKKIFGFALGVTAFVFQKLVGAVHNKLELAITTEAVISRIQPLDII